MHSWSTTYLSGCEAHDRRTRAEASQTPSSAKHGGTENQLPVDICVCRHRRIVFQGGGVPNSLLYTARSKGCWAIRGRATGCELLKVVVTTFLLAPAGPVWAQDSRAYGSFSNQVLADRLSQGIREISVRLRMRRATFSEREHVTWAGSLIDCVLTCDWHELVSKQRLLPFPDKVERYQVQADSPTHHLRKKCTGGFFLSALVLLHINSSNIYSFKKQCPAVLGFFSGGSTRNIRALATSKDWFQATSVST
jgi:hypothetical protein